MKRYQLLILATILILPATSMLAADKEEEFEAVPEPPDIPEQMESGQPIEPEVTIIRKEDRVIQEYRINGMLYMVKITPVVGKPYYLIDNDGDGRLETRRDGIYRTDLVPQWILFSW